MSHELRQALEAIASMKVGPETNHEQLCALMIAVAKATLRDACCGDAACYNESSGIPCIAAQVAVAIVERNAIVQLCPIADGARLYAAPQPAGFAQQQPAQPVAWREAFRRILVEYKNVQDGERGWQEAMDEIHSIAVQQYAAPQADRLDAERMRQALAKAQAERCPYVQTSPDGIRFCPPLNAVLDCPGAAIDAARQGKP